MWSGLYVPRFANPRDRGHPQLNPHPLGSWSPAMDWGLSKAGATHSCPELFLVRFCQSRRFPQAMRHSLHSHIIYLENKVQSFRDLLTRSHLTADETESLKAQIYQAELALEHYRQAYALELSVSSPEPPDSPETKSSGGSGAAEKANSKKKIEGRAGIARLGISADVFIGHAQKIRRNRLRPEAAFVNARKRVVAR